jgi:hypothetical protein
LVGVQVVHFLSNDLTGRSSLLVQPEKLCRGFAFCFLEEEK